MSDFACKTQRHHVVQLFPDTRYMPYAGHGYTAFCDLNIPTTSLCTMIQTSRSCLQYLNQIPIQLQLRANKTT
eukprot:jgi/Botrbrau1/8565/Bobra.0359s0029.1